MSRIKANIVAVTAFIDGEPSCLFFNGTNEQYSWYDLYCQWRIRMQSDGHKVKMDMRWRSGAAWPDCGCEDKWASPNAFSAMFDKEGAGRKLEDISFEPYRYNLKNTKARARFKAQA